MLPVILAAMMAAATSALPSYIALPSDQIAFLDLRPIQLRVPRQTLLPPPLPYQDYFQRQLVENPEYRAVENAEYSVVQNPEYRLVENPEYRVVENPEYRMLEDQQSFERTQYKPIPALPQRYAPIPIEIAESDPEPTPKESKIQQESEKPDAETQTSNKEARPADFGEYVDFGAHTGENGAFGWYADYPLNNPGERFK